jgi:YD repeat-containing protein
LLRCLITIFIFHQAAYAQGTPDPASETYNRWANATKFVGTFSWGVAYNFDIDGRFFHTYGETINGSVTASPDSGYTPVIRVFGARRGGTLGSLFPLGAIEANGTAKAELVDVDCGKPGARETDTTTYQAAADSTFVPLAQGLSITLLAPNALANPSPGTAMYKITAVTVATGHNEFIACDGRRTSGDLPAVFLLTPAVGESEGYLPLPIAGNILQGSQTFLKPAAGASAPFPGTFSWNLVGDPTDRDKNIDNDCKQGGGSTVSCENQTLGEDIGIVGAPFSLHYESDRVPGREESNEVAKSLATQLVGWTVSLHHAYDPATNRLYMGTGERRDAIALGTVIRRVDGTYLIASDDTRQIYVFNVTGQHLKTRDALTGVDIYKFTYDAKQRLISVSDVNSNTTKFERNAAGKPTGILSPFNQRTLLALDANGYLSSVTNPANVYGHGLID